MEDYLLILLVLGLALVSNSKVTALAAGLLLVLKVAQVPLLLSFLEKRGVDLGLLFLILAMLAPFVNGKVPFKEIAQTFTSLPGILALLGGAMATHLNSKGIALLDMEPQLIIGMIVGSLLGIVFFGGVPVGPLMAGGLTALFLRVLSYLR